MLQVKLVQFDELFKNISGLTTDLVQNVGTTEKPEVIISENDIQKEQ